MVLFISVDSLQFDGLVLCYVTQGLVQASHEMKVDDVTCLSSYRYRIFTTKQPNSFKKVQDLMSALVFQKKKKIPIQRLLPYLSQEAPLHECITPYHPHGLQVLPPSVLRTTTPMGSRNNRHQPYKLLPP